MRTNKEQSIGLILFDFVESIDFISLSEVNLTVKFASTVQPPKFIRVKGHHDRSLPDLFLLSIAA